MLSYNLSLWFKANTKHLNKANLIKIFGTMFLDIFSLSFTMGYSIYFKNVALPHIDRYQFLFIVSGLLLCSQLLKTYGFFYASSQSSLKFNSPMGSIILIGFCYLLMTLPSYFQFNYLLMVFIVLLLLFKSLLIGYDLGLLLRFAQLNFRMNDSKIIFIFILLIYDLGILAGIFTTRLVIEGEITPNEIGSLSWLQEILCFLIAMLIAYSRKDITKQMLYFNNYSRRFFINNLKNYWKKIITRSLIVSYHVFLIYIFTFKVPSTLHIIFGYAQYEINRILLVMTILSIAGANSVLLTSKIVKPVYILSGLFVISIIISIIKMSSAVWLLNDLYYISILIFTAFIYGAFLRATPMALLPINDFPPRYQLTNRFMSYMLAYAIWGMLAIFILDSLHYINHRFKDDSFSELTIFYVSICLIGLYKYVKEYRKQ